jgi:hypothetical protein
MRVAFDVRTAGYPVTIVMFLVAIYCLLVGSDWIAGALAAVGTILLTILARTRGMPARKSESVGLAHR